MDVAHSLQAINMTSGLLKENLDRYIEFLIEGQE